MNRRWTRTIGVGLSALLVACLLPAASHAAKRGGGKVSIARAVNAPVPEQAPGAGGQDGILASTINLGRRLKGRVVRDVNVTVQTQHTSGAGSLSDLEAWLFAPNGSAILLFERLFSGATPISSIGPLTLDDEAALDLGGGGDNNPTRLYAPWSGSAAPEGQLWPLHGSPARGAWTLKIYDRANTGTDNLVAWRLTLVTGRPFATRSQAEGRGAAAGKRPREAVRVAKVANLPIPDEAPPAFAGIDGRADAGIVLGKRFRGLVIRDVDVTLQTVGTGEKVGGGALNGPHEAIDLAGILRAPNGAHVTLFETEQLVPPVISTMPTAFGPLPSAGPLTLDDEAPLDLLSLNLADPNRLQPPYAGSARPPDKPLALLDGGPLRGRWTLTMLDGALTGTSTLASWRLRITAGRPFLTKGEPGE